MTEFDCPTCGVFNCTTTSAQGYPVVCCPYCGVSLDSHQYIPACDVPIYDIDQSIIDGYADDM